MMQIVVRLSTLLPLLNAGGKQLETVTMIPDHGLTPCSHGLERRNNVERRTVVHRREEIRFEMKDDRRSGVDRRKKKAGWERGAR